VHPTSSSLPSFRRPLAAAGTCVVAAVAPGALMVPVVRASVAEPSAS
jgi:hypothetical protein